MPVERTSCDECGESHNVCPECGERFVTPRDNPSQPSPTKLVDYGGDEEMSWKHVCWNCGWEEKVRVTIERD